jgi:hypothetical protein
MLVYLYVGTGSVLEKEQALSEPAASPWTPMHTAHMELIIR